MPFESARLGFETAANDLDPVAVLIEQATLDWPMRFGNEVRASFDRLAQDFGADGIEYARDIDGQRNVRGYTGVRIKDATSADSWLSLRSGNLTAATPTNGHPPVDAPPNSPEPVEDPDDVPF